MFENLSDRLERSFKILKGEGKITEINVAETLKDVRRALLDADVNYKVAKTFTDTVKQKALGMNVLRQAGTLPQEAEEQASSPCCLRYVPSCCYGAAARIGRAG